MDINHIYNSECLIGLKSIPDNSIHCCVTSPPYYKLRDYGHKDQIGIEKTPEEYIQKLVDVFREVKRVMKDDGTLWINIGDSYNGSGKAGSNPNYWGKHTAFGKLANKSTFGYPVKVASCKPKDLIGIPWMLAFALRADGWYLRQDIIWNKPSVMPESVRDRCTKSHEYIFLLSKNKRYYFDSGSIAEPATSFDTIVRNRDTTKLNNTPGRAKMKGLVRNDYLKRNKRSVWTVNTQPSKEAHFAVFPEKLIIDCIKAGCPEGGVVIDPFMGSGTTAVVARKLNRNYIGFELNPEFISIANRRLDKELGMFKYYWKCIIFPNLKTADEILVVAHGNSLRGIIKHLKHISDEEIVKLNLPTAVPYVFEFSDELNLEKDYFLGDPEEIRKLMEAVANQGKKK